MSYGTFVNALNKESQGCIVAYDNAKGHGGCILHLRTRPSTIFVPSSIITNHWDAAIQAIQEKIRASEGHDFHLAVNYENGMLTFEPQKNT
ncbi:hypothetical protein H0A65_01485 [Alcaligenaceae bacterium]|nr:hypothetical protein [Alcaligenaceae bacterium]